MNLLLIPIRKISVCKAIFKMIPPVEVPSISSLYSTQLQKMLFKRKKEMLW